MHVSHTLSRTWHHPLQRNSSMMAWRGINQGENNNAVLRSARVSKTGRSGAKVLWRLVHEARSTTTPTPADTKRRPTPIRQSATAQARFKSAASARVEVLAVAPRVRGDLWRPLSHAQASFHRLHAIAAHRARWPGSTGPDDRPTASALPGQRVRDLHRRPALAVLVAEPCGVDRVVPCSCLDHILIDRMVILRVAPSAHRHVVLDVEAEIQRAPLPLAFLR